MNIKITLRPTTSDELVAMLEYSKESIVSRILNKHSGCTFILTKKEAVYLRDKLWDNSNRVFKTINKLTGADFLLTGDKLSRLISYLD